MNSSKEQKFNLAFNCFLVFGMFAAVAISTVFKLKDPDVRLFMMLLAAFGSVMGVVSTVMSANGNILTFVFGFLDVLIGTIVYYDSGIMGTFALHAFYFLPMQFVGFWQWSKRGAKLKSGDDGEGKVKARRLTGKQWIILLSGIAVGTVVVYFILLFVDNMKLQAGRIEYVDKWKIFLDAVVMIANIAGQILMSLAFMEQWYLWLFVNISSISLWLVAFLSQGYSGTALVMTVRYFFYLLNVLNGIRIWLALSREK